MSVLPVFKSDVYDDGMTKQAFKDSTDINRILARAARGESLTHLANHGAVYGDFSDIDDLLTAHKRLEKGQEIFDQLPGEVRREFNQDVAAFFKFVNDPANAERLPEVLPELAKPGNQAAMMRRTARNNTPQEPAPGGESEPAASGDEGA